MEVINRLHKGIKQNQRLTLSNNVRVERKMFKFSAGCGLELGIVGGLYMHFINDDDKWLFYINSEKDGFPITSVHNKNATMVTNSSLCQMFFKKTRCSENCKFPVRITDAKVKDAPVYEILINQPIEE